MVVYALAVTGLSGLTVPEKIERGGLFVSKLTGNAAFPSPDPSLATVGARIADLSSAWKLAQKGSEDDTRHLHQAEDAFDLVMLLLWAYVQHESQGDAEKILSTGMDVKDKPTPHREAPAVPTDLVAAYGTAEGSIALSFRCATTRSRSFRVRYRAVGATTWTEWSEVVFVRKATLTGLPSGVRHEFQVRTESRAGTSAWSNTVSQMVP